MQKMQVSEKSLTYTLEAAEHKLVFKDLYYMKLNIFAVKVVAIVVVIIVVICYTVIASCCKSCCYNQQQ